MITKYVANAYAMILLAESDTQLQAVEAYINLAERKTGPDPEWVEVRTKLNRHRRLFQSYHYSIMNHASSPGNRLHDSLSVYRAYSVTGNARA